MTIELCPASRHDEPVLQRLLELYSHELSDVADLPIGPDGLYGYRPLPKYWTEPERHPYLLRVDDELAGFVLVRQGSEVTGATDVWDMAEFFVLRRHRRHGLGVAAAHAAWQRHPGRWEIRVMEHNTAALGFWQRAVETYLHAPVEPASVDVPGKGKRYVLAFSTDARPGSLLGG